MSSTEPLRSVASRLDAHPSAASGLPQSGVSLLELAVSRVELSLQHWLLRGLHSGRVQAGVDDLDLVGDREAVYLLTRRSVDASLRRPLEQRIAAHSAAIETLVREPLPDDVAACRLAELVTRLSLPPLARDIVLALLAVAWSARLARVVRFAAGPRRLSLELVADLLTAEPHYACLSAADLLDALRPLEHYGLVELEVAGTLAAADRALRLADAYLFHALATRGAGEELAASSGDGWWVERAPRQCAPLCIERASLERARRLFGARKGGSARRVVVYGDEALCDTHEVGGELALERFGTRVCVDLGRLGELDAQAREARLREVRREAILHRAVVCLEGAEVLESADASGGTSTTLAASRETVARWLGEESVLEVWLLSGRRPARLLASLRRARVLELELAATRLETRLDYWAQLVEPLEAMLEPEFDARALLSTYQLSAAELRELVRRLQAQLEGGARRVDAREVHRIAALVAPAPFGGLARRVALEFEREDLKLPGESSEGFDEMIAFARHSDADLELLGPAFKMSQGRAVAGLFKGPPGTGKTMAAAVLARELGRALYQVNLAQLTSKWVGETEKNLERIFDQAQREGQQAVLLLDEADSIASRRSGEVRSANDKHANNVTNFLLQRLESFTGTVVMTTNNAAAMDPALMRRLQFKIEFPEPDVATRQALWQRLLPAPLCAEEVELAELGAAYALTGGTIKSALRRAAARVAARRIPLTFAVIHEACVAELRQQGHLVRERLEGDVW